VLQNNTAIPEYPWGLASKIPHFQSRKNLQDSLTASENLLQFMAKFASNPYLEIIRLQK